MALSKFMGYAGVLSNINACREFVSWTTSGIINAVHYRRHNIRLSTTTQHQLKDTIEQLMDDLWKLKTTMPKMLDLIDRVEWQSHKKHATDLLPVIKDAVYDAEDLLDEFDYYELKLKIESSKNSGQDNLSDTFMEFFKHFIPDGYIKEVNRVQAKLDHVHRQLMDMHLDQEPQKFDKLVRPETCSFIDEPKIFGREEELKQLVRTLIVPVRKRGRDDSISAMVKLHVLPIVGMGGVGKTTIAQQICNDANVKQHFGKNIFWTCVSDDFDIKRLTKEILQHSGEGTSSDNLDIILKKLEDFVKFKRFLIVLDDMWDDILKQDGAGWTMFFKRLENGAEGSRILVTTRSFKVANLVNPMNHYELNKNHYELKGLKDGVFWDFFKLCAFGPTSSCNNQESLECIGKSILPKLKGSPLAAKTIGRLLRMNLSTTHWENIAESELWRIEQKETTDILQALRLSYMYLPQKLKRCFSLCAMYPKDHQFDKDILGAIWIAQGYVMDSQEASVCFEALADRSFFQKQSPDNSYFVIHDLMHDMAQLVTQDECFFMKQMSDLDKIPSNVRHLSIFLKTRVEHPELHKTICSKKKLRTLVFDANFGWTQDNFPLFDCWFKGLLRLRVLRLVCSVGTALPESMGNLKHLRYFASLDNNSSFLGRCVWSSIPSSISRLHHLKIIDCGGLEILRFPPGFSDGAISLQKIKLLNVTYDKSRLEWSGMRPCPASAESMFEQMEALPHRNLQHFKVQGYVGESFPSWLQPHLQPRLRSLEFCCCGKIKRIPFFDNTAGAGSRSDNNNSIEELVIRKCDQINWQGSVELPTSLRKLILSNSGYSMDHLVSSFRDLTFLTDLQIDQCESLTVIPLHLWSSNLPSLKELQISFCPRLTTLLGVSRANSSSSGFRGFSSLSKIHISFCYKLSSLEEFLTPDYLPAVKIIYVEYCALTTLSVDRLDRLQMLSIVNCPKLNPGIVMVFPESLKELFLWTCGSIEFISINTCYQGYAPKLEKLTIWSCPVLRSFGVAAALDKIKNVKIGDCPELKGIQQPLIRGYVQ